MADLEQALGQFFLYHALIEELEADRQLYLALDQLAFVNIFEEPIGQILLNKVQLRLLVFDAREEVIRQWIP